MLSSKNAAIIAKLAGHIKGTHKLRKEVLQLVLEQAAEALSAAAVARGAMAEAAANRPKREMKGRPPSIRYIVECAPMWATTVVGVSDAYALISETLAEYGEPIPAKGSLGVYLSTKGEWSRLMETDVGTLILSLRKEPQPKAPEPTKPAKPKGMTGRQRLEAQGYKVPTKDESS